MSNTITPTVFYRTLNVEGLKIFYREHLAVNDLEFSSRLRNLRHLHGCYCVGPAAARVATMNQPSH
jgi:hypothetical protein